MSAATICKRSVKHRPTHPTFSTPPAASAKGNLATLPGVPGVFEVLAVQSQQ